MSDVSYQKLSYPSILILILLGSTVPADYGTIISFTLIIKHMVLLLAIVAVCDSHSLISTNHISLEAYSLQFSTTNDNQAVRRGSTKQPF